MTDIYAFNVGHFSKSCLKKEVPEKKYRVNI